MIQYAFAGMKMFETNTAMARKNISSQMVANAMALEHMHIELLQGRERAFANMASNMIANMP